MVDNDVIEIHQKLHVLNFAHLFCLKLSINKMFVIGLVLICFLKLSLDIIDSKTYKPKVDPSQKHKDIFGLLTITTNL